MNGGDEGKPYLGCRIEMLCDEVIKRVLLLPLGVEIASEKTVGPGRRIATENLRPKVRIIGLVLVETVGENILVIQSG